MDKRTVSNSLSFVLANAFNKLEDGHRNACLTVLTEYESGLASGMAESYYHTLAHEHQHILAHQHQQY